MWWGKPPVARAVFVWYKVKSLPGCASSSPLSPARKVLYMLPLEAGVCVLTTETIVLEIRADDRQNCLWKFGRVLEFPSLPEAHAFLTSHPSDDDMFRLITDLSTMDTVAARGQTHRAKHKHVLDIRFSEWLRQDVILGEPVWQRPTRRDAADCGWLAISLVRRQAWLPVGALDWLATKQAVDAWVTEQSRAFPNGVEGLLYVAGLNYPLHQYLLWSCVNDDHIHHYTYGNEE